MNTPAKSHLAAGPWRRLVRALALLGLLPVVAGCAAASLRPEPAEFPLLAPATLGATRQAQQLVYAAFGAQELAFQCVVSVGPQAMTVLGIGALGERWFSLQYDGLVLDFTPAPNAPAGLPARRILADLQLALWPLGPLQAALSGSAWQVSEAAPGTRRLRRHGRLIAEVHYAGSDPWQGRLWLSNFASGYTLTVESRPLQ